MKRKAKVVSLPQSKPTVISKNNIRVAPLTEATRRDIMRMAEDNKRGFEAAEAGRLIGDWIGTGSNINSDILSALFTLRSRSRDLRQNNPLVKNYFKLLSTNVVGPRGFTFRARTGATLNGEFKPNKNINDNIETHFARVSERGVLDLSGKHSLVGLCNLIVTTVACDGEALVLQKRFSPTKKNPYGYGVQVISADRLDLHMNRARGSNINAINMGVEIDVYGNAVAYHFTNTNTSGTVASANTKRERVLADDVLHIFNPDYPEQTRGIPWLHSVMTTIHHLKAFQEAALIAQRQGASRMGFYYNDSNNGTGPEATADYEALDGTLRKEYGAGQIDILPPGWKYQESNQLIPSNYGEFIKTHYREFANGVSIVYNSLLGDLENVNYSSIRQALIAEREMYQTLHTWLIESFLEPIFDNWLKESIKNNKLNGVPDSILEDALHMYSFHGRTWQWVDPRNDIEAAKLAKDLGVYSPQHVAEMMGTDIWAMMAETAAVRDVAKTLNIKIDGVNDPELNAQHEAEAAALEQAKVTAQANADAAKQASEQAAQAAADANAQKDLVIESLKREVENLSNMFRDFEQSAKTMQEATIKVAEIKEIAIEATEPLPILETIDLTEAVRELEEMVEVVALEAEAAQEEKLQDTEAQE